MAPKLKVRLEDGTILILADYEASKKNVLRLRLLQGECLTFKWQFFIWARNGKNREIKVAVTRLDLSESSIRILNWEYDIEWEEK